jgi:transcriptional regulator with XRE-family HTH domain
VKVNPWALTCVRERSGFTQTELARRSGISQGRISELEHGDRHGHPLHARPSTARALANALDVPILAIASPTVEPQPLFWMSEAIDDT